MTQGKRVFLITLGIAGALIGVAYFLFRPTWKTATEAEVRAVLNPALLATDPLDAKAQERSKRVDLTLKRVDVASVLSLQAPGAPVGTEASRAIVREFLLREEDDFRTLEALLAQGALQRPMPKGFDMESLEFSDHKNFYKGIGLAARELNRDGDAKGALRILRLGLDLSIRSRGTENTLMAVLVGAATDAILHAAIRESLPKFDEAQLRVLADRLPPLPAKVPNIERAVRGEFQTYLLPMIPDPLAWGQRQAPNDDPKRFLRSLFLSGEGDGSDAMGSYDALQTARDVDYVLSTTIKNAELRRTMWDKRGADYAEKLASSLPEDKSAGESGIERWLHDWQYRWELNRLPNSMGRRIMSILILANIPDSSLGRHATYEASRTLIALRRYRLRHGHDAGSLDALVRERLLPSLPIDPYGGGNLRYDAKRRRLWSVGMDGKDDGGNAFRMGAPAEPDLVWKTP